MVDELIWCERDQLDLTAYKSCILRSTRPEIYAMPEYLNGLAEHWGVLVKGAYEAVMPIPFKVKFGFKRVYQPIMIQRLGVFASVSTDETPFYRKLRQLSPFIDYTATHVPNRYHSDPKDNYYISLEDIRGHLTKHWNSNRLRDLKKSKKYSITTNIQHLHEVEVSAYQHLSGTYADFSKLWPRFQKELSYSDLVKRLTLIIEGVTHASLLYGVLDKRLYYLLPELLTTEARKIGLGTRMIYELIQAHISTVKVLDFEGSNVPGVSRFYQSFGSGLEHYAYMSNHGLHWLRHAR